ncbi:MAG: hypothetical protein MT490_03750 [Sphingomonas sp.]|uniref:hypothetical protein n=1 Tax=Sphingomonas sp. TaxID=28214 RepID=UPI0022750107|nr:hypothetical protein [Sphingomonas sp.]MCX8474892.1 hypothetical protein [Sphingomonas sp.]
MRNIVTIAAILSLAGCGGGERMPANDTIAVPENGTVTLPAPPETPEPAPSAVPSPTVSASPDDGAGIPTALHGRWGLVPADCTSTGGDNKGLLTITGDTLRFYESVGTLGKVVERDPARIVADFAMTGEGQEWTRRMVLDAQEGGKALVRREQGPDAMLGLLRYQRCA